MFEKKNDNHEKKENLTKIKNFYRNFELFMYEYFKKFEGSSKSPNVLPLRSSIESFIFSFIGMFVVSAINYWLI
jgi:hypothetical protein